MATSKKNSNSKKIIVESPKSNTVRVDDETLALLHALKKKGFTMTIFVANAVKEKVQNDKIIL